MVVQAVKVSVPAGLLQLVFTVVVLVVFIPIFHSFWLGLLWQVRLSCPPHLSPALCSTSQPGHNCVLAVGGLLWYTNGASLCSICETDIHLVLDVANRDARHVSRRLIRVRLAGRQVCGSGLVWGSLAV